MPRQDRVSAVEVSQEQDDSSSEQAPGGQEATATDDDERAFQGQAAASTDQQPCGQDAESGTAITANDSRRHHLVSSAEKLELRELGLPRNKDRSLFIQERFRNITLQEEYRTYSSDLHSLTNLPILQKREIIQIWQAGDAVLALCESGLCVAFNRCTNRRACIMNHMGEIVTKVFYNKTCESFIVISDSRKSTKQIYRCQAAEVQHILQNEKDEWINIFQQAQLEEQTQVRCCERAHKAIIWSGNDRPFQIYSLHDYSFMYSIPRNNPTGIATSEDILILFYEKSQLCRFTMELFCFTTGISLKEVDIFLDGSNGVQCIQLINENILIQHRNGNIKILNLKSGKTTEIGHSAGSKATLLPKLNRFLLSKSNAFSLWDMEGKLVRRMEDPHPNNVTAEVCVCKDEPNVIISYFKTRRTCIQDQSMGKINVTHVLTGKCLAEISQDNTTVRIGETEMHSCIQSTVAEALEEVTAIFFNKELTEIYTGNKQGLVHVWSN